MFWEKQQLTSCFIKYLHLSFHLFLDFFSAREWLISQGKHLQSVKLPWAIGLKVSWFLIALSFYPNSVVLGLSFLNPRDLWLWMYFSRGSSQKYSVSTCSIWCWKRNWVAWIAELTVIFNPSYVCDDMNISGKHLLWGFLEIAQQNLSTLGKTSGKHLKATKIFDHWDK